MKDTLFESKAEMPPQSNSPDVVRTALTMSEARRNLMPAHFTPCDTSVENVQRPRRGHGY